MAGLTPTQCKTADQVLQYHAANVALTVAADAIQEADRAAPGLLQTQPIHREIERLQLRIAGKLVTARTKIEWGRK